METPRDVAAPQHSALPQRSYAEVLGGANTASSHVTSLAQFKQRGARPLSLMKETATSSPLIWQSKDVNAGEGHIAGLNKTNRGTALETGF
jgi:hypothetical protein